MYDVKIHKHIYFVAVKQINNVFVCTTFITNTHVYA